LYLHPAPVHRPAHIAGKISAWGTWSRISEMLLWAAETTLAAHVT
jgi:hypothetical protein